MYLHHSLWSQILIELVLLRQQTFTDKLLCDNSILQSPYEPAREPYMSTGLTYESLDYIRVTFSNFGLCSNISP